MLGIQKSLPPLSRALVVIARTRTRILGDRPRTLLNATEITLEGKKETQVEGTWVKGRAKERRVFG